MAKERKQLEEAKVDMTPMIDIVFNLVIFFLIVTDLSKKDIEQLTLPDSEVAKEDTADEESTRLILNIVREKADGKTEYVVKFKGQKYTHKELRVKLRAMADNYDRDKDDLSEYYVLIRADRDTPWKQVQLIMQDCAQPDTRIWKLQFATRDEDPMRTSGGG